MKWASYVNKMNESYQKTSTKNKLHPMYINYIFGLHEIEFPLQYIVSEVKNTIL